MKTTVTAENTTNGRQKRLSFPNHDENKETSSKAMQQLLERIGRNEEIDAFNTLSLLEANTWKKKGCKKKIVKTIDTQTTRKRRCQKNAFNRSRFNEENHSSVNDQVLNKMKPIDIFRTVARKIQTMNFVFHQMRRHAIDLGGHGRIGSKSVQFQDVSQSGVRDLLFNAHDYKSRRQFSVPLWAQLLCATKPEQRSIEKLQNLRSLMKQLKDFRKYSGKMQMLLVKIVRYESFARRRVIIRKGHRGLSFYIVFSGSVGVVFDADEDIAFTSENAAHVMRKGDSFGELALVRDSVRSATVVCMEYTELLVIDKDDFLNLGVVKFAREEMMFRMNYIKTLDLFSSWDEESLREIAAGGKNVEFLTDRVVEEDTTKSEHVNLIVKGHFEVVRLLDFTVQKKITARWNHIKKNLLPTNQFAASKEQLGLGAYMKVAMLSQGEAFGLNSVLKEDDRYDCNRKFTLLSAGCEIIRIPKSTMRRFADDVTLEKIKESEIRIPTDSELFEKFKQHNDWKSFKEDLIDHANEYDLKKLMKDRCTTIPRFPRVSAKNYARMHSPITHCNMMVKGGQLKQTDNDGKSDWNEYQLMRSSHFDDINKAKPFIQDRILTAKGSRRTLVLTHGGSRVNRSKDSIRASLVKATKSLKSIA